MRGALSPFSRHILVAQYFINHRDNFAFYHPTKSVSVLLIGSFSFVIKLSTTSWKLQRKSFRNSLDRRLNGPQNQDSNSDPSAVEPVTSRYTDWAIEALSVPQTIYCGVPFKVWLFESKRTSIAKQRLLLELVSVSAEINTLTTAASETRT
jgi:hypothetical protein